MSNFQIHNLIWIWLLTNTKLKKILCASFKAQLKKNLLTEHKIQKISYCYVSPKTKVIKKKCHNINVKEMWQVYQKTYRIRRSVWLNFISRTQYLYKINIYIYNL